MKMLEAYYSISIISTILMVLVIKRKNKKGKRRPRRIWSRNWLLRRNAGRDIAHLVFEELQYEDPKGFQNFVRMTPKSFFNLLEKVKPMITRQDTVLRQAIPAKSRLLLTLRYLATGDSFADLAFQFRISVPAISGIIPETINAIYEVLKDDYLKFPNTEDEWKKISKDFEQKWNFPLCLGAIDGKHIAISGRKEHGSYYFNYKGFNSIILMAIVDANYRFLYVDIGANGRANDSAVFNESSLGKAIYKNTLNFPEDEKLPGTEITAPYVFVADDAFKLSTRILKPYGQRNNEENKIFNYRLSRARRIVENAFGILSSKFRIFQKEICLSVEKIESIVLASCALHNFIRTEDVMQAHLVDNENISTITLTEGSWRRNVFLTAMERLIGNRSSDDGIGVRQKFSNYFNGIGFVPWQWEAIKKFNF